MFYNPSLSHLLLHNVNTNTLMISKITKKAIKLTISVEVINTSLLFNVFTTWLYIVLLASNGAKIPKYDLLMATIIIEVIQKTILIAILISKFENIILIVPIIKRY